jgi:hypothetical protein
MTHARLAVLVVAHNTRAQIGRLLASLEADPDHRSWDVLLLDNESADGTLDLVSARYPWVRTVRNAPQRGYAAAVNQGVAMTIAPLVAMVNPDTVLPPGALARLADAVERDAAVAAAGPLIRLPDGRAQRQGLAAPRPLTAAILLLGLAEAPLFRREAERYFGPHEPGPPRYVEILPGTCVVVRREALVSVGPLDERFFIYCEDVDWSIRAGRAGWKLLFVPEVEIQHEKAAASRTASARSIRLYYRSVRVFYAKHHAPGAPLVARAFWYAGAWLKEGIALAANALRREKGLRY